jgi:CPA2 family monovalent cation:H+ antiporter-2
MRPSPGVVRAGRDDDLSAMTKASDLVLVDRKQPARFIVPYLGRPARRLLRSARAPMLAVAGMPRGAYRRVVVATDLQTDLGPALAAAKRIAPNATVTLLHVYHVLFEGKLQWAGVPEVDIAEYRVDAQREAARGMASLLDRHRTIEPDRTLLRYGWPVPGVLRTSDELDTDADLIVAVRNSRSWWTEALGASVSLELAQRADRDVLVVHAPPA